MIARLPTDRGTLVTVSAVAHVNTCTGGTPLILEGSPIAQWMHRQLGGSSVRPCGAAVSGLEYALAGSSINRRW